MSAILERAPSRGRRWRKWPVPRRDFRPPLAGAAGRCSSGCRAGGHPSRQEGRNRLLGRSVVASCLLRTHRDLSVLSFCKACGRLQSASLPVSSSQNTCVKNHHPCAGSHPLGPGRCTRCLLASQCQASPLSLLCSLRSLLAHSSSPARSF